MKEELLHFIWKYKFLSKQELRTLDGELLHIIQPGIQNDHDGPDFLNARVRIGSEEWVGNVEIHIHSEDWDKHKHTGNDKYKNLILHVVYQHNKEIKELTFQKIPTLELKGIIPDNILKEYQHLMNNKSWVPCGEQIKSVDPFIITAWLERLLIERIERKTEFLNERLSLTDYDWNQVLLEVLFESFGFKRNSAAMRKIAEEVGYITIKKEKETDGAALESLLLGAAGFLPSSSNHFRVSELIKRFDYQKVKYELEPLDSINWNKGGVRPKNQPFIRLIQLIGFLQTVQFPLLELFSGDLKQQLTTALSIQNNSYWNSHIGIELPAKNGIPRMGAQSVESILINALLPFQFYYARYTGNENLADNALEGFAKLNPERNSIVNKWKSYGVNASSAKQTQALLELKNNYCSEKKCLFCAIGNHILTK